MGKSYHHIKAIQQPDRTACWSTTMSWWTKAVASVPNQREVDVMGMYQHLTGDDGGIKFPSGFKTMLEDTKWGMTIGQTSSWFFYSNEIPGFLKYGPIVCGYWDYEVGGYHAVALYNYNHKQMTIWAMDPNGGKHINRELSHYYSIGMKHNGVFGYRAK